MESRLSDIAAPSDGPMDAAAVIARLEEAGLTLLALPNTGPSTRLVQGGMEWIRNAAESYGMSKAKLRPAVPSAAHITRMDQAYQWLSRIPEHKYVLRRVVGARSLVNPMTGRHLYSWRRLGTALGADHKAIQRWHAQGIDMIVAILNGAAPPVTPETQRSCATLARMRAASPSLGFRAAPAAVRPAQAPA